MGEIVKNKNNLGKITRSIDINKIPKHCCKHNCCCRMKQNCVTDNRPLSIYAKNADFTIPSHLLS